MPWQHRIRVTLALMVVLAAIMLGIARHSAGLALLAVVATGVSLYCTDIRGWFHLHRWVANIVALSCVGFSIWTFFHRGREYQLLSIADLIIYLQIVLLFQEKNERVYWQIALLSLLEIVVCCALTTDLFFAICMVLFVTAGMVFFWLQHGLRQTRLADPARAAPDAAGGFVTQLPAGGWLKTPPALPFRTVLAWGAGGVVLAATLFVLLPRSARSIVIPQGTQSITGFSETVKLGQLGETIENPDTVMHVRLTDPTTNANVTVSGSLLMRGSVLMTYRDQTWQRGGRTSQSLLVSENMLGLVRQEIELKPTKENVLFSVFPPVQLPNGELLIVKEGVRLAKVDPFNQYKKSAATKYQLGTLGLESGAVREIVPSVEQIDATQWEQLLDLPAGDPFPRLRETAERLVRDGSALEDPIRAARALVHYLRDSDEFRYSLQPQPRDPQLDPIEDFIAVHRAGHCEYYASALCLMLRQIGIPARVAVGYRAQYNPLLSEYVVRQLDAHAWVEAYLMPDQIPAPLVKGWPPELLPNGGWLVLDATPAAGEGTPAQSGPVKWWRDTADYLDQLWGRYVIAMDGMQQDALIYAPLRDAWNAIRTWLTLATVAIWETVVDATHGWGLLGVVILAALAVWCLERLRPWQRWRSRRQRAVAAKVQLRARPAPVDFFVRWEALCRKWGLPRPPQQTPREFVRHAGWSALPSAARPRARQLAESVVEAFYRVRFGGRALDKPEAEAVEHALRELEALARPPT